MKKSFSLIELVLVIVVVSIVYATFIPKVKIDKLEELTNRILLQLKQVRYQAMIDDKYKKSDTLWFKKRWTMKFFNCKKKVGGIYYSIYSDTNMSGHPKASESLRDPLTNKYIYSSNDCKENSNNSKYVLLSKNFDIVKVDISCNRTSTIGQLSFGTDGEVYSKLSTNNYKITKPCIIKFKNKEGKSKSLKIENKTGLAQIL